MIFFSGVFPLAKTLTAAIIFRQGAEPSPKLASLLNILGKWSMLDVFLAALLGASSVAWWGSVLCGVLGVASGVGYLRRIQWGEWVEGRRRPR